MCKLTSLSRLGNQEGGLKEKNSMFQNTVLLYEKAHL